MYTANNEKWSSHNKFLDSEASGPDISSVKHKMHFSCAFKKYKHGSLKNEDTKKVYKLEINFLEKKLLAYIEIRTKLHKQEKCGVSFGILRVKVMKWAKEAGISEDNFTASNGCISGVLKRNGKISINLHV